MNNIISNKLDTNTRFKKYQLLNINSNKPNKLKLLVNNNNDNDGDNNFSIIISVTNQMGDSLTTPISISVVEGNVTSWIFNHAGAEGRYGPTQEQVDLSYSNTNLAGKVTMIHQGIQEWSVPNGGYYKHGIRQSKRRLSALFGQFHLQR